MTDTARIPWLHSNGTVEWFVVPVGLIKYATDTNALPLTPDTLRRWLK